ncbi:FHA domain-containing protein [Haliangium sp.]|uniref:FHA domain-containing protein n=1 Tax=Haliangium sp. TaxID=2663208 RepID=UPI003D10F1F4
MATLKHLATGTEHVLTSELVAGRSRHAGLRLNNPRASANHASIRWTGDGWELRDLKATNGTFVDDHRLADGDSVPLVVGTRVGFGDLHDPFELVSDLPPEAVAYGPDGAVVHAVEGHLALPSPDQATLWVEREEAGVWSIETDDGTRRVAREEEHLDLDGQSWRLELPVVLEKTARPEPRQTRRLRHVGLRFTVSPDEEFVDIDVVGADSVTRLRQRAHHYLLLVLARRRLTDLANPELPESEHGWIELAELLHLRPSRQDTTNALNLAIYRARQQLREELGIEDQAGLVERRRGAMIRIGVTRLEILP